MSINNPIFIGFGKLEDLMRAPMKEPSRILYLDTCIESLPSSIPHYRMQKFFVVAARIDGTSGPCNYWRMPTGMARDWGNGSNPEKDLLDAADKRTLAAASLLHGIVSGRGFEIAKALIATPKDYLFMDGTTELVRYDKAEDTYVLNGEYAWM
jgi:hypothetical protein